MSAWIGNELDKSFAPKVKKVEKLEKAYVDEKGELARDIFSWITTRPDFHDPDPDSTELTPPTLKAASEYLEMLIENLPYQDKRILLEIVDMWAVGLDYGDEVKAS